MHDSFAAHPPRAVLAIIHALESVYWWVRDIVEGQAPLSVTELAVVAVVGLVLGFVLLANAAQVVATLLVMSLGVVWGVVLGLIAERVSLLSGR